MIVGCRRLFYTKALIMQTTQTLALLDVESIRKDFPTLHQKINGKPLVYFDNGATAHKPEPVIQALDTFHRLQNANVHRGIHTLSQKATDAYEASRGIVQRFLNAPSEEEIIFTSGTTMAFNLMAYSFSTRFLKAGDVILVSEMEHHANIVPWQLVGERLGLQVRPIPITDDGQLDMEAYERLLNERVKLVSVTHVSNVLGTVNPVAEIIAKAHAREIPVMLDGAQSVPHMPIDLQALDVDFFCFSGHKTFGPTGIGVLYGKKKWLAEMPPFFGGGDMIKTVSFEGTSYNVLPHKFEAGTPNIAGVIGLGAALAYLMEKDMVQLSAYEQQLFRYANEALHDISEIRFFGEAPQKAPIFTFAVGKIHPYDLGMILDKQGIAIRTGHHCTQPLHARFGITGSARASMTFYNTFEEVDVLVAGIRKAQKILG